MIYGQCACQGQTISSWVTWHLLFLPTVDLLVVQRPLTVLLLVCTGGREFLSVRTTRFLLHQKNWWGDDCRGPEWMSRVTSPCESYIFSQQYLATPLTQPRPALATHTEILAHPYLLLVPKVLIIKRETQKF